MIAIYQKHRFLIVSGAFIGTSVLLIYLWSGNWIFTLAMSTIPVSWVAIAAYPTHGTKLWVGIENIIHGNTPSDRRKHIPKASIVSQLSPHLDPVMEKPGATLVTVGGDAHALGLSEYPWRDKVMDYLKNGSSVIQYVSEPTPEAQAVFVQWEKEYPNLFECRTFAHLNEVDELSDRRILSRLRTLHPTLAWNAEGEKFLWVEGNHPFGSTQAMDCDCYPTGFLANSPKPFLDYSNTLDKAWAITKRTRAQERQDNDRQGFDNNNQRTHA